MKIKINKSTIDISTSHEIQSDINIIFGFGRDLLPSAKKIIKPSDISPLADLTKAGSMQLICSHSTLLLSLGSKEECTREIYLKALKKLATYLSNNSTIKTADITLEPQIAVITKIPFVEYAEMSSFHLLNYLYYFDENKSTHKKLSLTEINFVSQQDISKELKNSIALLDGVFKLKHLANNPANIVTPTYLAETAESFKKISKHVKVKILDHKDIKHEKMNAFLAVAKGSVEEPKFITLEYSGGKAKQKPIVLVGKGITFDSGGISLKPSAKMDEMRYDMCGAATVLSVFLSVIQLHLPINLVVLVPTCENMPSGCAVKPGDIVTTMNGLTVEILNTDAEGRLILCDALTYAKRYSPECVIDVATLTGACIVALGHAMSGMFSNDDALANALLEAGSRSLDKIWRMPLGQEYHDLIKGLSADIANIATPSVAGSSTAACFLEKFVDYKWAHLDIAGTAWNSPAQFNGEEYIGASGRPFYLLMNFLRNHAHRL